MTELEVIRTPEGVRDLRVEWDALCNVAVESTPFQRPAWALAWLEQFGTDGPVVLALRCGHDLVGLMPAFLRGSGGGAGRTLCLMGAGVSDHLDALAAPGFVRPTLDAIHEWLHGARLLWTSCVFDELGPRAVLRELRSPPGTKATIEPQSVCPVLVSKGETDLDRVVPPPQLARMRKAHHGAGRMGRVDVARADGPEERENAMRTLVALHARRWELRREPGMMGDPRARRMHDDVSRAFASRAALRLYRLDIDGKPAAVVYGFRERQRLYLYLQGTDPTLERASAGTLVVGYAIADALAEGIEEVDFLRGGEAHKYAWGAMDEANARMCIAC